MYQFCKNNNKIKIKLKSKKKKMVINRTLVAKF